MNAITVMTGAESPPSPASPTTADRAGCGAPIRTTRSSSPRLLHGRPRHPPPLLAVPPGQPGLEAEPNPGPPALAELRARTDWLITQNVDGLHQRAGSPSRAGAGAARQHVRRGVHGLRARSTPARRSTGSAGDPDPACRACGGILKTTTVMFGEVALHRDTLAQAIEAAEQAGCSSRRHLAAGAAGGLPGPDRGRAGARLVIVNAEPTPYDELADEVIRDPIGVAVPRLLARLSQE